MITLDQVLSGRNILRAIKQVVSNKGAPGIDGMTVDQYEAHHRRHWRSIAEHIRAGSYIPAPVRRVAVLGGAGDSALESARAAGVDVYLTADLRHHPASEHLEGGAPALLCGSHWATESPWLPVLARKLRDVASAADVELHVEVSTIVTEPWTSHRVTQGELA